MIALLFSSTGLPDSAHCFCTVVLKAITDLVLQTIGDTWVCLVSSAHEHSMVECFQDYQYIGVWGPVTRSMVYKHATKLKPTRALQASQRANGKEYWRGSADSKHQELGFQLACLKLGSTCSKVLEVCAITFERRLCHSFDGVRRS